MKPTYWLKQTKTLFPELEWNKPERRDQAGRLLIIGGNIHSLSAPAEAFDQARKRGIGTVKIMLPDKTKRLVGSHIPETLFLPSTTSGEFSQDAEAELIQYAHWADTVLLCGDNGRNSQTTILFESLLKNYSGQVVLTRDAVDILTHQAELLLSRSDTTLVLSFAQLQKILQIVTSADTVQFTMGIVKLVETLQKVTRKYQAAAITCHESQLIAAVNGTIVTTKVPHKNEPEPWRLDTAVLAACYQTWYTTKPAEALAQACFHAAQSI